MGFDLDSIPIVEETQIKYYTSAEYINDNFIPEVMQPVHNPEDADILIFENEFDDLQVSFQSKFKIGMNQAISGCNCIIEKRFILEYLRMLDNMRSEEGLVSMADPTDVIRVTRGSLYHYSKHDFAFSPNDLMISLPETINLDDVGIIVYLSQNDSMHLSWISELLAERYKKSSIVLMQPSIGCHRNECTYEIFIFKW